MNVNPGKEHTMTATQTVYRISVYLDDERVRLYDIAADTQEAAEQAAVDRATNLIGVGISSSDEDPDDTFTA